MRCDDVLVCDVVVGFVFSVMCVCERLCLHYLLYSSEPGKGVGQDSARVPPYRTTSELRPFSTYLRFAERNSCDAGMMENSVTPTIVADDSTKPPEDPARTGGKVQKQASTSTNTGSISADTDVMVPGLVSSECFSSSKLRSRM